MCLRLKVAMMTVSETLETTWAHVAAELGHAPGVYERRLPVSAASRVCAGIILPGPLRRISFEVDKQFLKQRKLHDETKGYRIEIESSTAGHLACINIREVSPGSAEIFSAFCSDIVERWVANADPASALQDLTLRLELWKRFFQSHGKHGLSREEYIGLFGELFFLESGIADEIDPQQLVTSWSGPIGSNQDFLFGKLAIEIKVATANEADRVYISNARQLDNTGLDRLLLVHLAFDFRQGSGRTLKNLVSALRTAIKAKNPVALDIFEERLLASGFVDSEQSSFDSFGFTERKRQCFEVSGDFPRIVESDLLRGVSEVRYVVNLAAALSHSVPFSDGTEAMRQNLS
jgi:hypothetical protein